VRDELVSPSISRSFGRIWNFQQDVEIVKREVLYFKYSFRKSETRNVEKKIQNTKSEHKNKNTKCVLYGVGTPYTDFILAHLLIFHKIIFALHRGYFRF